jgi:hypothetical protein
LEAAAAAGVFAVRPPDLALLPADFRDEAECAEADFAAGAKRFDRAEVALFVLAEDFFVVAFFFILLPLPNLFFLNVSLHLSAG